MKTLSISLVSIIIAKQNDHTSQGTHHVDTSVVLLITSNSNLLMTCVFNFVLWKRYMEENPRAGLQDDESDVEIEYDEDGNPIAPKKSKVLFHVKNIKTECSLKAI